VLTGFLPTRASSVVKLGGAQHDFFTLAELLAQHGYATSFIYGGDADFDNMRRFFMNNGFQQVIDERAFERWNFRTSWGVSDEDVYARAHEHFLAAPRPFFTLLFTTSNHSPFEIPPGRITPYDPGENTVHNAVQYADHALGEFLRTAKAAPYWQDTLFLVVADHNSRVTGAELVPVERFHIPGVLLGADVKPQRIERLASQIDLLPTLLSWLGIDSVHPAIGDDLTRPEILATPGRAVMRYHDALAYREGDRVVIDTPRKAPLLYYWREGKLQPSSETDIELLHRARVFFEWPVAAYRARSYRLPVASPGAGEPSVAE
jgi:phosphoglycerol transferase MdoB-like AlkP superfamily enzyme